MTFIFNAALSPTVSLQRGKIPSNKAICWPWVETCNALGGDPGGWALYNLATEWLSDLQHFTLALTELNGWSEKPKWSISWLCQALAPVFSHDRILQFAVLANFNSFYFIRERRWCIRVNYIGQVGTVFANGPGDHGSIPGCVIPKTLKMVLGTSLLNTQQYKVCIKGKVEQSRERSSILPYTSV